MNTYNLSREFCNRAFENHRIKPNHYALYFFCVDLNNRLGWKENFGLPTNDTMEAIGIKNYKTYIKTLNELIEFGFIELVEKSKNQYTANIIALVKNTKAQTEALPKALSYHNPKHCSSTDQSIVSIDKQVNNKTIKLINDNVKLVNSNLKNWISEHKQRYSGHWNSNIKSDGYVS